MIRHRTPGAQFASTLALSVATLVSSLAFVGCSSEPNGSAQNAREGQVQVVVAALSQADVSTVTITVSGGPSGAGTATVPLTKQANGTWTGVISGIAVGTGYTFTMTAKDSSGNTIYAGIASSVTVTQNQVAEVVISGQQTAAASTTAVTPPVIDSILVSSTKVAPGASVTLAASAHDANPSDTLTYAWTATAGTFSAANNKVTNWVAPAIAGTYPLTLVVTDTTNNTSVSAQVNVTVNVANGTGSAELTVGLNTWPVVSSVVGTPNYLVKAALTALTAIATDADNDPVTYAWTSSCPGVFSNAQVPTPNFTLDSGATNTSCTLTVNVADNRGGTGSGTLTLPVGTPSAVVAPKITQSVQSTQTVGATDSVTLTVNATDPQGQALTFSWAANGGTLGTPVTTAASSQVVWAPPAAATNGWLITATVTDASGAAATKTFNVVPSSCFGVTPVASTAWTAGIMDDTQWIGTDDGKNPNSDAVDIINQLNAQFIAKGVKFVIQLGDLTDSGSVAALDTRAQFAQALYNANIGYFPLRGNHESTAAGGTEFKRVFPQTMGGMQNNTPADAFVPNADDANDSALPKSGVPFMMGANFSEPSSVLTGVTAWDGLSYSFDYNNARFVLLDQFMKADGTSASGNYQITPQQAWISATLAGKPANGHAFSLGHKGLITQNHVDTLFGADPSKDPAGQDAFITSLANNGVRFHMGGHDHMHNRAIVTTTDGVTAKVQNVVAASDSSKYYIPANPSNDVKYDVPAFGHTRETPIAQELNTVGIYYLTIDGIKATVDFYSAAVNPTYSGGEYLITTTPPLTFTKRESFGYGLNGKAFVVAEGQSYTSVQDTFGGTTARILSGTNSNTNVEPAGRQFSKTVDTGWNSGTCSTSSDILSLWTTVSTLGSDVTDTLVLSMSYNATGITPALIATGTFGLATKGANGNWINAVNKDVGGTKTFVNGPWQASYGLGTYGVDTATNTVWAVINYGTADFAAATFSLSN